jgi:hypothetical protein
MEHNSWETPTEFSRRMGMKVNAFSRKVRRSDCPQNFEAVEGKTGRIVRLKASPELEAYMRADGRTEDGRKEQIRISQEISYGRD